MRKIFFVAIWSALLAACTTDSYDSGDTPLSYLWGTERNVYESVG